MPKIFERWRQMSAPQSINVTLSSDASTQVLNMSARELYQTQDNLRAVVDFLADSIAALPLKVYKRNAEDDRERDRDSVAARTLWRPNDYQTSYEFIRGIVAEYKLFGCVYVWVTPDVLSASGFSLHIIPSDWVEGSTAGTAYKAASIKVRAKNGKELVEIPATEWVQFKTYSPGSPGGYCSPVSALRQTLHEQVEAGRFRRSLWRSSGRLNAQITRPKDVQPWSKEQKEAFATAFREAWGAGGSKAGSIPIMEDGMKIEPFITSFKESEWAASVKLSRESVAAIYRVNPSMIWHSETQTYASVKENARALYSDTLAPDLQMLQQRINAFLFPMLGAENTIYCEFDLSEKLKGSFEERASIMQSAVGAPWLTRNEARAENNLPPVEGGDELVTPLNVLIGGQASPQDSEASPYDYEGVDNQAKTAKKCACEACKAEEIRIKAKSDKEDDEKVKKVLDAFFERQLRSILPKINSDNAEYWNAERWDKELADDLEPVLDEIADKHGIKAAEVLKWTYTTELTRKYIRKCAEQRAKRINQTTKERIDENLASEEPDTARVYEVRKNTSATLARAAAGAIVSFAVAEAAHQATSDNAPSVRGRVIEKEWVTGDNARPEHAAMNGERVPIDADFSNGQHFPGEDIGDPTQSCGCNCTTQIIIGG